MGRSMVQALEEQPGDLGSDFGLPQTLGPDQKDKIKDHVLLCPRDIQVCL